MDLDTFTTVSMVSLAAALILVERTPGIRRRAVSINQRWLTNIGLLLLGGILASVIYAESITAVAAGLHSGFVRDLELPIALEAALVFLLLDAWRYWEHRLFHEVPLLWRIHLVHHSDTEVDVTTSQRHHPFEGVGTTLLTLILIFALGFSVQALALYLLVATLSAVYTHANVVIWAPLDKLARKILVTPSVHAIHHSSFQPQTDSNYGGVLTFWDRLFGTYRDPAVTHVNDYGLEYFRSPKDTALGPTLLQPFEYRRSIHNTRSQNEEETVVSAPTAPIGAAWQQSLLYGAAGLILVLVALWPTALDLARVWLSSEPYQYAWLVLPTFVYVLAWYHRDAVLSLSPQPSLQGLWLVFIAAAIWIAGNIVDIKLLQHFALVLTLQGIALCAVGWSCYRSLLPSFLLLFLMVPYGDIMQPLLRGLTVKWIEWFALLMGIPHQIDGYVAYIGTQRYVVIDACSGLTLFAMAGFLGYSFGLLLFRSLPKVLALAALGALLGIVTNAARVCLIVGIDWVQGSQMDLDAHTDIQWAVMLMALAGLLYFASTLEHDSLEESPKDRKITPSIYSLSNFAPVMGGVLIIASVGIAHQLSSSPSGGSAESLAQMSKEYPQSRWMETEEGGQQSLAIPIGENLDVVVIAQRSGSGRLDTTNLRPETGADWRHADTEQFRDCKANSCINFTHTTWRQKGTNNASHTFSSYFVNDRSINSKLSYRLALGWNQVLRRDAKTGLISFMVQGDVPESFSIGDQHQQLLQQMTL